MTITLSGLDVWFCGQALAQHVQDLGSIPSNVMNKTIQDNILKKGGGENEKNISEYRYGCYIQL